MSSTIMCARPRLTAVASLSVGVAALSCVGMPAAHGRPGAATSAGVTGSVVVPNADGVAVRTARLSYRPATGALYVFLTLNRGLPKGQQFQVRFGRSSPGTANCGGAVLAIVTFTGGSGVAQWTGDAAGGTGPFKQTVVSVPSPGTELSGALRSSTLIGQSIDCAEVGVVGSAASPVTQQPVAMSLHADSSVPPVAGVGRPALQLDYQYAAAILVRHRRAAVSMTCVTARASACTGDLRIMQQFSHRLLGRTSVTVRLGDTVTIPVTLRLPRGLSRSRRILATATLQPLHGPRSFTTIMLER